MGLTLTPIHMTICMLKLRLPHFHHLSRLVLRPNVKCKPRLLEITGIIASLFLHKPNFLRSYAAVTLDKNEKSLVLDVLCNISAVLAFIKMMCDLICH
ncbi:putative terpene synthase 2 [Dorcoceras hygrometricum]|uniref:Putative terpene synthase 2 n=1 Tax=Dorcoceras hygrometricum TaxID=472368 RepID=A0A2Z7BNQ3_9LAMI|nr:putative terpene synthase 2 [Dorcoceras hygrometricum]